MLAVLTLQNVDGRLAVDNNLPLFGSVYQQPELDRSLVGIDELHDDHMRNASRYYGWAITMAAMGHNPHTPDKPMRLPSDRDIYDSRKGKRR